MVLDEWVVMGLPWHFILFFGVVSFGGGPSKQKV